MAYTKPTLAIPLVGEKVIVRAKPDCRYAKLPANLYSGANTSSSMISQIPHRGSEPADQPKDMPENGLTIAHWRDA